MHFAQHPLRLLAAVGSHGTEVVEDALAADVVAVAAGLLDVAVGSGGGVEAGRLLGARLGLRLERRVGEVAALAPQLHDVARLNAPEACAHRLEGDDAFARAG